MAAASIRQPLLLPILSLLLSLSPLFNHPVASLSIKKTVANRVRTRQTREAVFHKDARTLIAKLRSSPQLAASVPFARDVCK